MDLPIVDLAGHVLFAADGTSWAVWRVTPTESARSTDRQLHALYERTVGFAKALRGQVLIASLCEQVPPRAVILRCLAGIDLDANPHWAETVHNTWAQLEQLDVLGRTYWVAKPLGGPDNATSLLRATAATLAHTLTLPTKAASRRQLGTAQAQATQAAAALGGSIPIRPATEAEILWWLCRAGVRGIAEPELDGQAAVHRTGLRLSPGRRATLATLRNTVLDEGGRTDFQPDEPGNRTRRLLGPLATLSRRFVKVITAADPVPLVSYQALLTLAEMPRAFTFPGSEILARLADLPFGVDYVLRIDAVDNETAKARNRRRTRNLLDQDAEHGADGAGIPADLASAQDEQQHKNARLGASSTEVDLDVGVIACVWAPTAEDCQDRATRLRAAFAGSEYRWERPLGGQIPLWWAMLPATPTPRVVRDYAQNLLASDFAMMMPFSATEFGDPTGALFGMVVDQGALAPYHLDPTFGPTNDASGGIAFCGELGSGKSVALKNVAAIVRLMLNGRVIAIDRTRSREWLPLAAALPGNTRVVDIVDPSQDGAAVVPRTSCDPLRVFAGKTSTGIAETFFAAWLNLESSCPERDALGAALDAVTGTTDASSNTLIAKLTDQGRTDPAAAALAARLHRYRRDPITAAVFDETLPAVDLHTSDMVVFCTHEVPLPTQLEMSNPQLAARIPPRKLFGRALHLLIAAIAREVCFSSDRWGQFCVDEAHSVTGTGEGLQICTEFVREGRKHGADAAFATHDPRDLGDEVLRGLIAVRFLGRHRDEQLARNGLTWLGLDPNDPGYRELVTKDLSPLNPPGGDTARRTRAGEFLVRDHFGRIGKVKVLTQPYRTLPHAVLTTPTVTRGATDPEPQ